MDKKTKLAIAYFVLTVVALGVKIAECKIKAKENDKEWFEL